MRGIYLVFALLGLFWGSNFIYMKWAAELITPAQITLLRVFFGFLPLAFVSWRKGVIHRDQLRQLPHFLIMAMFATAFYYLAIAEGTALLPSGVAGILGGSISLFTTIATLLFLRNEKPNAMMLAGVLIGFAGISLIAQPWKGADRTIDLIGVLWMVAATIILGVSYVYVRRFLSPHNIPPLALATWQTGLALVVLLIVVDRAGMSDILQDWHAAAGVAVGLGVLGTGMAFLIYYYLLQELGAVAASGATYITPNVALLIGWVTGEKVGVLEIAAIILVLGSIAMLQIGRQLAR
ncbi:Integral Membrane Protein [Agrobacterium tumefaciens]|nr:Integral Membrane Protein [Agrobacterium tumefaciens]